MRLKVTIIDRDGNTILGNAAVETRATADYPQKSKLCNGYLVIILSMNIVKIVMVYAVI